MYPGPVPTPKMEPLATVAFVTKIYVSDVGSSFALYFKHKNCNTVTFNANKAIFEISRSFKTFALKVIKRQYW